MTRPIQYACGDGHCECGSCALPPTRDLDALKSFNAAVYSLSLSLILVAFIAAIFAAGLIREENRLARNAVIDQENIATAKGAASWH